MTLLEAVDVEDVANNPLYRQGRVFPGSTWCNLFASNVAKNLGIELPFVLVNEQLRWIRSVPKKDWTNGHWVPQPVDAVTAYRMVNEGFFVLAFWEGPNDKHGHVAVLLPSSTLAPIGKEDQIAIAQAGRTNFSRGRLANGFDSLPVQFYVHTNKL